MKRMDDDYINHNDIVKRYLGGKLTPEETVEFEEHILDKPELLEQLEMDSVFTEHLPNVATDKTIPHMTSIWQKLFGTPMRASMGTATACVLVATVFVKLATPQLTPLQGNIELVYLSNTRGDTNVSVQELSRSAAPDTLIFILQADAVLDEQFKVRLFNQKTEQSIALLATYSANEMGDIYVPARANNLPQGTYIFEYHPVGKEHKKQTTSVQIN